jgi:hypothetical protein
MVGLFLLALLCHIGYNACQTIYPLSLCIMLSEATTTWNGLKKQVVILAVYYGDTT